MKITKITLSVIFFLFFLSGCQQLMNYSHYNEHSVDFVKHCEYRTIQDSTFKKYYQGHEKTAYKIMSDTIGEVLFYYDLTNGGSKFDNIEYVLHFLEKSIIAYKRSYSINEIHQIDTIIIKGDNFLTLNNLKCKLPNEYLERDCCSVGASGGSYGILAYVNNNRYHSFYEFNIFPCTQYYTSINNRFNKPGRPAIELALKIVSIFE